MTIEKRIVFAGSPDFAVPTLNRLCESDYAVTLVLTQPDRPAGRGRRLRPSPVKVAALSRGLPVIQPEKVNDIRVLEQFRSLAPHLMVVAAYGQILGPELLTLPSVACVNVHASLLPRWRGASPVQAAILAGDAETGVSIMAMDEGLDTGPVFSSMKVPLTGQETGQSLHDELSQRGADLLLHSLPGILDGSLKARAQAEAGVTYAPRLSRNDSAIDWNRSAREIERQIRAMNPWPVAETVAEGEVLRCWDARLLDESATKTPGSVLATGEAGIDVATGNGVIRLTRLQRAGRQAMDAASFVRGCDLDGRVLGR